ncbi:uncharacterized protein LOC127122501 [Lathyrus oleraceus]|nr:uncharacterized protein LOC127122501 [Pisum sativum]
MVKDVLASPDWLKPTLSQFKDLNINEEFELSATIVSEFGGPSTSGSTSGDGSDAVGNGNEPVAVCFLDVGDNGYPRVAIIRDREKDRSDPDYDRSYGRYARSLSASTVNLVPFNLPKAQPSFAQYDITFNQLGQMAQTQASLGYGPPSTPIMSPFCTPGLNPSSGGGAYLQWPSPTMMYAHSYDQFRHVVYQAPFGQPLSFDYSQNY